MSARDAIAGRAPAPPISFGRLVAVELRKLTDTRSGFTLVLAVFGVTIAAAILYDSVGTGGSFSATLTAALTPATALIAVLAIVLVTTEFTTRTAFGTFTLVPRRERVVAAKAVAATLLALALGLVALVVAVILGDGDSPVAGDLIGRALLKLVLCALMGLGFGLALRTTGLAIALYFVAPPAVGIALAISESTRGMADWVTPNVAWEPLTDAVIDGAAVWPKVLVATAVWVALPLAIGIARLLRTDIH